MAILSAILVTFRRTKPSCDLVMAGRRACAFNKIRRALDFFQDWWAKVTHGAKNGGSFSEIMGPEGYQTNHSWHFGSILYLHTDTYTCIHIDWCLYNKTCLKWALKKEDQLSLNAGQKNCRMLQGEHSAIPLTFIKLQFIIKIWVAACLRHVLLYWQPTCTFCL